jgi:hypothetical protein
MYDKQLTRKRPQANKTLQTLKDDEQRVAINLSTQANFLMNNKPYTYLGYEKTANDLLNVQQNFGNRFAQKNIHSLQGIDKSGFPAKSNTKIQSNCYSPGSVVQRDGGASVGVGLALSGLGIVQNQVNGSQGGLNYTSDQITYPNGLQTTGDAKGKTIQAAKFFSSGAFSNNETKFCVHGYFGQKDKEGRPTLANVYIDLEETTSYTSPGGSLLSFNARAEQTPVGTPNNPRIRFVCSGRFDPAGVGDCSYRVVLEIDQYGSVKVIKKQIVNGKGNLMAYSPIGFLLIV